MLNLKFIDNTARYGGGGIKIWGASSSVVLYFTTFSGSTVTEYSNRPETRYDDFDIFNEGALTVNTGCPAGYTGTADQGASINIHNNGTVNGLDQYNSVTQYSYSGAPGCLPCPAGT